MEDKLIEFVRKNPILYDKKMSMGNRSLREELWKELARECNVDVTSVKIRWKSLRDHFVREYRKTDSSSGKSRQYSCAWPYFNRLYFLKDVMTPRRRRTKIPAVLDEFLFIDTRSPSGNHLSPETSFDGATTPTQPTSSPVEVKHKYEVDEEEEEEEEVDDENDFSSKFSHFLEQQERLESSTSVSTPSRSDRHTPFLEMMKLKLDEFPDDICEDLKVEILVWLHEKMKEHCAVINSFVKNKPR